MINAGGTAVSRAGSALPASVTLIMEAEKPQQRHSAGAALCQRRRPEREIPGCWFLGNTSPRCHFFVEWVAADNTQRESRGRRQRGEKEREGEEEEVIFPESDRDSSICHLRLSSEPLLLIFLPSLPLSLWLTLYGTSCE